MSEPSIWLHELTWEDVRDYLEHKDIIIVPCGATEQHGPAGPLGLDGLVAIGLAEDAAKQAGVLCAPPLWYGDSSHHLGFPGTVSLRTETLIQVATDIMTSLAKHGFRKILLLNGHKMTNLAALTSAARNLREYDLPGVLIAVADPMYLARGIASKIKQSPEHHAGELEISQTYFRFPDTVKADKFSDASCDFPGVFGPFGIEDLFSAEPKDVIEQPWTSAEQRQIAPTGQFSSTLKASKETGQKYHEYMVARLVKFLAWWKTYQGPLGRSTD